MTDQEIVEIRERLIRVEKLSRHSLEFDVGFMALISGVAFFFIAKDSWDLGETARWLVAVAASFVSLAYSYKRYGL